MTASCTALFSHLHCIPVLATFLPSIPAQACLSSLALFSPVPAGTDGSPQMGAAGEVVGCCASTTASVSAMGWMMALPCCVGERSGDMISSCGDGMLDTADWKESEKKDNKRKRTLRNEKEDTGGVSTETPQCWRVHAAEPWQGVTACTRCQRETVTLCSACQTKLILN